MTNNISIQALEGKTIREILQLEEQHKNLPEGFKITYQKPKIQTAQQIIDELKGGKKLKWILKRYSLF